jgi:acetyltransferase
MNQSAETFEPRDELVPWQLPDGTPIRVRQLAASDRDLEIEFLESLSERTKYLRLMTPLRYVSRELLARFMDVNGEDRAALVATTEILGRERFIAVARYAATSEPGVAELAITVADAWQHRGIATRLLARLILYAHRHGFTKLAGLVLPENTAMLGLARKLGAKVHFDACTRLMNISIDTAHFDQTSGAAYLS